MRQVQVPPLTPKLKKLDHTLEWIRIEKFVEGGLGSDRNPHDRGMLANAFVAKSMLRLDTTAALIARLAMDRLMRRICGFPRWKRLPSDSTFSRAFQEFARTQVTRIYRQGMDKH